MSIEFGAKPKPDSRDVIWQISSKAGVIEVIYSELIIRKNVQTKWYASTVKLGYKEQFGHFCSYTEVCYNRVYLCFTKMTKLQNLFVKTECSLVNEFVKTEFHSIKGPFK